MPAVPVFSLEGLLDLGTQCFTSASVRAVLRGEVGRRAKRRSDGNLSWL